MTLRKHIPNFITMLNLFSGSMAVYYAFNGNFTVSFFAILIAGLFDFLDGLAARALKAYSPMGKELDSLADVISFGLAPGVIVFSLFEQSQLSEWLKFAGFIIPVFSALRLAKFNIDENQSSSFIGLPTPANAIFWAGMGHSFSGWLIETPWVVLILTLLLSGLLVSKLPMFSLKFKNLRWADNKIQYIFLGGCIALISIFGLSAFAPIIGWYILTSAGIYPFLK
ncbi:MAG: CDP-diacylglycerol--serine O-phosphatidyltransferase [Paludibacter sp.]|nr:CDP-diacylglycerol--serine O-phosphatidyltransferase [Paludibacter sp.]MDD4427273.1 CDP-diacylglycerol--serine O-phosphatidyltransferase [Paludibacter sp.]